MKEPYIKLIDREGIEHVYIVLFSFDSSIDGKSYVVYTDYSKNDSGKLNIYSSCYSYNENNELKLEEIVSEREKEFINSFISKKLEELNLEKRD